MHALRGAEFVMLTERQADAIAVLVHELRPEWDTVGVKAQLRNLVHRRATDVALACIRAAADPHAKTPGVIPSPGPHWSEGVSYEAPRFPKGADECTRHPGQWADNCHSCTADHLAATGPSTTPDRRRPDRAAELAQARANLAATTATLCAHGVQPEACTDHNPRTREAGDRP